MARPLLGKAAISYFTTQDTKILSQTPLIMSTVPLLVAAAGMDRSDSAKYVGSRAPKVAASTLASHNDAFARVLQFKLRAFLKGTNTKERTFTSDFLVYLRWDSGNEPKPEADPNQWDRVDGSHGEGASQGAREAGTLPSA